MIVNLRWIVPVVLVAVLLSGCKPKDEIRSYSVEKEPEPTEAAPAAAAPASASEYRFLGAMIPAGGTYFWFVRFFGPIDQVSPYEEDFNKFLASIHIQGDKEKGGPPLTWTLPDGWKIGPAKSEFRMVTLQKGKAEFYVSNPISGTILENVNRWRTDYVGIAKVSADELPAVTTEFLVDTTKAYKIDFRGPGGSGATGGGAMRGPFQGKK